MELIWISRNAVEARDNRDVVFVVKGESVERRAVKLGNSRDEKIEVLSCLVSGERIVIEGSEELKDGDLVAARE